MTPSKRRRLSMLCLILPILLAFGMAVSCGEAEIKDRTYDADEVIAAARELIPKAATVNELFYGRGLPVKEGEDALVQGRYREADPTFLTEHGIASMEDMKAIAQAAYADSFCRTMFATAFEAGYDDDVLVSYRRYFTLTATEERDERIMVDTAATVLLPDTVSYDLSSVTTDGVKGELVYIKVNVTVTREDGKQQTRAIRAAMYEEEDGWRFYELTGASYSEYFDRIEE